MKKILFALVAIVALATSVVIASESQNSSQSEYYPQCDSYKPTKIKCYSYNEGNGEWSEIYDDYYLHTNQNPWKVYVGGYWYDVVSSDRCEYKYMFENRYGKKRYFNY